MGARWAPTWLAGAALVGGLGVGPAADADPLHSDRGQPTADARKKSGKTGIQFEVTPSDVRVFIDGEERGTAGELEFVATRPGKHTIRLVRGGDELQAEIAVKKGQIVEFRYEFE